MSDISKAPRRFTPVLEQTVTIQLDGAPHVTEVDAYVWDQWAAHKGWGRVGWSVTHAPTGRRVPSKDLTEYQAKQLASLLAKRGVHFTPEESSNGNFPEDVGGKVQEILRLLRMAK